MTILLICGFESGSLLETQGNTGATQSIQSSVKRTGNYALQVNPATTATGSTQHNKIGAVGNESDVFNVATLYHRFYFRVDTLPSANSEEIFTSINSTGGLKFAVRITSAGNLQAYDSTGTTQLGSDGATALSLATWYRIEVKVGTGATGAYEVLIDGASELSGTGNLLTSNNAACRLGKVTNRNGKSVNYYYDDLAIDDAGYPGAGQNKILLPNGDGNYTAWTIGAGAGDKWQQVDEVPYDTADYLVSTLTANEAYTAALQSCAEAGIAPTSINAARAIAIFARDGAGNGTVAMRTRSATTDTDTSNNTIGSVVECLNQIFATDPATAAAWTTGGLDGVEVGAVEKETTDKTRLYACYLTVDYVPTGTQEVTAPVAEATAEAIIPLFSFVEAVVAEATAEAIIPASATSPVGTINDLTATAISSSEIDLAWTDGFADETGYKVERSLDGVNFTEIDDIAADGNSYSDTGLNPNTTYYYRVGGYNAVGTTWSNIASARTSADTPEPFQRWLVWDRVLQTIRETDIRYVALVDGVPEPDTDTGITWIYVDQTTGDLIVKFGDGDKYILQSVTAKVKEARIEAVKTTLGASAPTSTTRAVGASGGVEMPVLSFSKTVEQECFVLIHAPSDLDESVNVNFHLMWIPGASWSAGNYMWKLEYLIYDEEGGDITVGTPTTIDESVTPSNATTLIETVFSDAINLNDEQILVGRFYRDVANDNGDDTGEVLFFEISYTMADSW